MATADFILSKDPGDLEEGQERKSKSSENDTETAIKNKRKQIRSKITRTINRLSKSMEKHEMSKRRYENELADVKRDFEKAIDLNLELYDLELAQSTRLDKWEADLSNDFYAFVELVDSYEKVDSPKKSAKKIKERECDDESEIAESSESNSDESESYEPELTQRMSSKIPNVRNSVDSWIDKLIEFQETELESPLSNMSIATALYRLEASRDIPTIKLSSFDGSSLRYVEFIESFKIHIHSKPNLTDDMRMVQLKMHLSGNAEKSVSGLGSAGIMYATALKTLKTEFGQPSCIARAFINKLTKGDRIKSFDRQSLKMFAIDVVNCIATLKRLDYMADVNATESLRQIVRRMPDRLIFKWKTVSVSIRDEGEVPSLDHICQFLQKAVRAEFDPDYGDIDRAKSEGWINPDTTRKRVHAVQSRRQLLSCYVCRAPHRITDCPTFKDLSVMDRVEVARVNRLCYSCLVRGHPTRECRSKRPCGIRGCTRTHHQMLHSDPPCASSAHSSSDGEILMPVVRVLFRAPNGRVREGNVLIDSGAGATIIRKDFARALGLQGKREGLEISVVGGESIKERDSRRVKFFLTSLTGGEEFEVEAHEIEKTVISVPPLNRLWISSFDYLRDITFSQKAGSVDVILGVQYSHLHAEQEVREGLPFQPVGKRTRLGWIVIGSDNNQQTVISSINSFQKIDLDKMYDMESIGVQASNCSCPKTVMSLEDKKAMECFESSCVKNGDRYAIGLPWKKDARLLPNNKYLAERRLVSLEKSLSRDPHKARMYSKVMEDYVTNGWAEELGDATSDIEYYLPHHGVYRPDKLSTPLRVVFDPACMYQGASLNSFLRKGPCLIGDLLGVLLRFREDYVAFMGDISKMFLQVCLLERDTHVHRYLWRNLGADKEPTVYRLLRVTFGDKPSPDMASYVVLKIAEENEQRYPDAAVILRRDRYMDDLIHSCESREVADQRMKDLDLVLSTGSFKIKEWLIGEAEYKDVKTSQETNDVDLLDSSFHSPNSGTVKTLGVNWNYVTDMILFKVNSFSHDIFTKRNILSWISTIYDPLGLAGVVTIKARIAMQNIWRMKDFGWDDVMPDDVCDLWRKLFTDLLKLSEIKTQRCLKPRDATGIPELHVFADASSSAYGACAYLRWETSTVPSVVLVASKSRVTPLRQVTIPRLELMAALLASRLARTLHTELKVKPDVFLWTDSQIVVHWIKAESLTKKAFVSVRVAEIQNEWNPDKWYFVPTKQNPADALSRGLRVDEIESRWFAGPTFLKDSKESWPEQRLTWIADEENKPVMSACAAVHHPEPLFERFSSWQKTVRVVAYCLRFIQNLRNKVKKQDLVLDKTLSLPETSEAELYLIREAQSSLRNWEDKCSDLDPFISDGIIRVGGRLRKSPISYDENHPILLPSCHLSDLILGDLHEKSFHSGVERTLSDSRRKYWVIRGRRAVKKLVRNCVVCRKLRKPSHSTKMADLPSERLKLFSPPYTTTGIDLFGPLSLKYGYKKTTKVWGAVFTCATTRAIHLEIVENLSTDAFLHALRRFVAHHGWPSTIITDNGTSFVGTRRELRELVEAGRQQIQDFAVLHKVRWIFTTPLSPHQGGIYESLVKQTKRAIHVAVGDHILSWNEMSTLFSEIECLINSRPLGYCANDPHDPQPLTPNHFMIGRASADVPQGPFKETGSLTKRFQFIQMLVDVFWKRFTKEYLPTLMTRSKWKTQGRQLCVGDVVLVVDHNLPRGKWNMARVTEVYPGDDGVVRNVKVKTQHGEYKRSIQKCCLILEASSADVADNGVKAQ